MSNGTTLTAVNRQWSNRPADETYENLQDAYNAAKSFAEASIEKPEVLAASLRADVLNDDVVLVGKGNAPAKLTNWAFGQLATHAGAPATYLRTLPATLAVQNLNYGLKKNYGGSDALSNPTDAAKLNLYINTSRELTIRSINSERYSRIYNHELLRRCIDLQAFGWHNPRPFNTGAQVGTIWVSDHDMFVFQVNDENLINVPGEDRPLRRGYILSNSEVGAASFRVMTFLFDFMCANRLVWGAQNIGEINVRHIGKAAERVDSIIQQFSVELKKYANGSANLEEAKIAAARTKIIAASKDEVIDAVFAKLRGDVTRKTLEGGYDTASISPDTTAAPNSVWWLAQGITRYSQTIPYADERIKVDRAAGKLVEASDAF